MRLAYFWFNGVFFVAIADGIFCGGLDRDYSSVVRRRDRISQFGRFCQSAFLAATGPPSSGVVKRGRFCLSHRVQHSGGAEQGGEYAGNGADYSGYGAEYTGQPPAEETPAEA